MLTGYDQSGAVNNLLDANGKILFALPASAAAGVDGAAVNITPYLRDLSSADYTALSNQSTTAATRFRVEWSLGFPEYNLGDLPFTVRQSVGPSRQVKQACRVATTANIADLTSTSTTIDGVTFVAADVGAVSGRIAVVVQTTGAENGIYRIASITGANMRLVRAQDFDESTEVLPLTQIPVSEGTINPAGTIYEVSNTGTITIGTTALTFNRIPPASTGPILEVRNDSGGGFGAGDLVVVSGWSVAQARPRISLADADSATLGLRRATYICRGAIPTGTNGQVYKSFRLTGINSGAGAVGDPVFLSTVGTTTNTWTVTAPTGAADQQIVGRVEVVDAAAGVIDFDLQGNAQEVARGTAGIQSAIVPTWTGVHTFNAALVRNGSAQDRVTAAGDASYAVVVTDLIITGAPTINRAHTLPAATGTARVLTFKNLAGSASTITVTRAGADTIDGAVNLVLAAGQAATIVDAAAGVWATI